MPSFISATANPLRYLGSAGLCWTNISRRGERLFIDMHLFGAAAFRAVEPVSEGVISPGKFVQHGQVPGLLAGQLDENRERLPV